MKNPEKSFFQQLNPSQSSFKYWGHKSQQHIVWMTETEADNNPQQSLRRLVHLKGGNCVDSLDIFFQKLSLIIKCKNLRLGVRTSDSVSEPQTQSAFATVKLDVN